LRAKKHVLSQKPFVLDLDTGARLADLADEMGVKFAVNQNGRWAPTSPTSARPCGPD
jgi:predicted dehydrogenase